MQTKGIVFNIVFIINSLLKILEQYYSSKTSKSSISNKEFIIDQSDELTLEKMTDIAIDG